MHFSTNVQTAIVLCVCCVVIGVYCGGPQWKNSQKNITTHAQFAMTYPWIQGGARLRPPPLYPGRSHGKFCAGGGNFDEIFHDGHRSTRQLSRNSRTAQYYVASLYYVPVSDKTGYNGCGGRSRAGLDRACSSARTFKQLLCCACVAW
jgi:hypothetical protein